MEEIKKGEVIPSPDVSARENPPFNTLAASELCCKDTQKKPYLQTLQEMFVEHSQDENLEYVPARYKFAVWYLNEHLQWSLQGIGIEDARPTEQTCNTLAKFILNYGVRMKEIPILRWSSNNSIYYHDGEDMQQGNITDLAHIVGDVAEVLGAGRTYQLGKATRMIADIIYNKMCANEAYKYAPEVEATETEEVASNTPAWETDTDCLNPFAEAAETLFFATIDGRNALCANSLVVVKARQKCGKSYAILVIIRTLLTEVQFDTLQPLIKPRLVMVFDAEMAEVDLSKRYKPIYTAIGEENWGRLQVYSLLCIQREERWAYIQSKVQKYNPDIVVLDTITEVGGTDYNSASEASAMGEELKKLFAERLVFAVIHQNKSKEDTNAKGALGAICENLCSEAYIMKPDKGVFSMELDFARFVSNVDAAPLQFSIADNGEIMDCTEIAAQNEAKLREELKFDFVQIFGQDAELQCKDLVSRVEQKYGCCTRTANDKITAAYKAGSVTKRNGEGRSVYYQIAAF